MQNSNFYPRVSRSFYLLLFLLSLISAIFLLVSVTNSQMNYLSYLLYDKSHLSAVNRLLNHYVLRKLILAILYFLAALVLLYLYYFSYFQLIYLKLSILCILCILYIVSVLEIDTIFYLGAGNALHWQNASLVSCIFVTLFFVYLAFDSLLEQYSFLFILSSTLFFGCFSIRILTQRYSRNLHLAPMLFLFLCTILFLLSLLSIVTRNFLSLLQAMPVVLSCLYLLYTNYIFRRHDYDIELLQHRSTLYGMTVYVTIGTSIYLIILQLYHSRRLLMHSRSLNREVVELENSKHFLMGVLYSNIKNYLFGARTSLEQLSQNSTLTDSNQLEIQRISGELTNIDTFCYQVHNYTIFSRLNGDSTLTRTNLDLLFRTLNEKLRHTGTLTNRDSSSFLPLDLFSDLCPEQLLPSLESLILLLRHQNPSGLFHLSTYRTGETAELLIHFYMTDSEPIGGHRSVSGILSSSFSSVPDLTSLDYILSLLRHQMRRNGGSLHVFRQDDFFVQLTFTAGRQAGESSHTETFPCTDPARSRSRRLLFLSSSPLQEKEFQKILPFDRYTITITNDARQFMDSPSMLKDYSLIIMGNMYRDVYFRDFYEIVRRDYPMTVLPILLLLPDLYAENSFYIRSTINDYLVPPYSQAALSKKIHALVTVKKTADLALETQLEFWQSQINPHFIFNSMNSIMQICLQDSLKAYELLGDFSEYLRGHLISGSLNHTSTIQKELDLIHAYLEIEKARFGDKIHYELDTDCTEEYPILPLLIEPLVENSIKHSAMREKSVTVTVRVYQMEDLLMVQVADDGNGIPQDTIDKILANTFESNSIGLSNVCSRLRYYYQTVPIIESTMGSGTTVQFTIRHSDMNHEEEG